MIRTRRRAFLGGAVILGGLLSWWAAQSDPFTTSADAVTAIGIAIVTSLGLAHWAVPVAVTPEATTVQPSWPWIALAVGVVAWELVCFFLAPRVDHPTLSSLYDAATSVRAVRGLCFFGWLSLGVALIRR